MTCQAVLFHLSVTLPFPSLPPSVSLRVNRGMSLSDFKFIYYMEYAHRMWGRALGLGFALPCAYFAARGYIKAPLAARLSVLFGMGAAQGFVGWWMVKSGLEVCQATGE